MLTPSEFKAQWGEGLVCNTRASLSHLRIPDASKRFLVEAGLPADAVLGLQFSRAEDELLSMLQNFPEDDLPADYSRYYPIGVDAATILCLDERDDGHIYSIDIEGQGIPTRFVNSSVPQLAEFLLILRIVPKEGPPKIYTDEEGAAYTEELAQKFQKIDPAAMQDRNSYWSCYLEATLI